MALGKQLPIRLDPKTEERLEAAAQKAGTTKSAIIRLLAQTFVEQVVRAGQVILPPNWSDLLPRADERAAKSKRERKGGFVHACNVQEPAAPKPAKKKHHE